MSRTYQPYWEKLRDSQMHKSLLVKLLKVKTVECLAPRIIKAIRKEKDRDFNFKMDNMFDAWRLTTKIKFLDGIDEHGQRTVMITFILDRRSNL